MWVWLRMAAQALMNALFGRGVNLVAGHVWESIPGVLALRKYKVVIRYEAGGETKTQQAHFPWLFLARWYVASFKKRWSHRQPRCVIDASPGMEVECGLPLHQPCLYLGHMICI